MNGARALVSAIAANGIDVCFANPGTTELALVDAMGKASNIRCVLGLFEGVCTGAADGYARMLGRPAATLLHLGPGFANGIANLHNARRARSAVLNVIGDHATWHLPFDAPLTSDIRSLASPVSGHYAYLRDVATCLPDMSQAIDAAIGGAISTLVVPTDFQEGEVGSGWIPRRATRPRSTYDGTLIEAAASALRAKRGSVILLGSRALTAKGQQAAGAIAAATGSNVFAETFPARWDRGGSIPVIPRFPYFPEQGIEVLKDASLVLLVGVTAPVAYFGKSGLPSELARPGTVLSLATRFDDAEEAIAALAHALNVKPSPEEKQSGPVLPAAGARMDPHVMANTVAALLPENSIVVVEGATTTPHFFPAAAAGRSHTILTNTGGAIGQGMPVATGAALACPDRPVINLQADGSGAYTLQSLWTQARERLNVVTILCANRSYGILRVEFERANMDSGASISQALTRLDDPPLDWVALAKGFGVGAWRAHTAGELAELLRVAASAGGPFLIEAAMW